MKIPFANSIFSFSQKADANPMSQSLKDFSRTRASISAVVAVLLAVVYFSGTAYAQVVSGDYFVFEAGSSWRWLVTANATVVGEVELIPNEVSFSGGRSCCERGSGTQQMHELATSGIHQNAPYAIFSGVQRLPQTACAAWSKTCGGAGRGYCKPRPAPTEQWARRPTRR